MAKVVAHFQDLQVLFRVDYAWAVGKVPVGIGGGLGESDMVTLVGHKFGSLKGVAAL